MSTSTATQTAGHTAWHRPGPGRSWARLLTAPTPGAAWDGALARRPGGDLMVTASSELDSNRPPGSGGR